MLEQEPSKNYDVFSMAQSMDPDNVFTLDAYKLNIDPILPQKSWKRSNIIKKQLQLGSWQYDRKVPQQFKFKFENCIIC